MGRCPKCYLNDITVCLFSSLGDHQEDHPSRQSGWGLILVQTWFRPDLDLSQLSLRVRLGLVSIQSYVIFSFALVQSCFFFIYVFDLVQILILGLVLVQCWFSPGFVFWFKSIQCQFNLVLDLVQFYFSLNLLVFTWFSSALDLFQTLFSIG